MRHLRISFRRNNSRKRRYSTDTATKEEGNSTIPPFRTLVVLLNLLPELAQPSFCVLTTFVYMAHLEVSPLGFIILWGIGEPLSIDTKQQQCIYMLGLYLSDGKCHLRNEAKAVRDNEIKCNGGSE